MSQEPRVMGPESSQETRSRCEAIVRERITRQEIMALRQPHANSMAEALWP